MGESHITDCISPSPLWLIRHEVVCLFAMRLFVYANHGSATWLHLKMSNIFGWAQCLNIHGPISGLQPWALQWIDGLIGVQMFMSNQGSWEVFLVHENYDIYICWFFFNEVSWNENWLGISFPTARKKWVDWWGWVEIGDTRRLVWWDPCVHEKHPTKVLSYLCIYI